MQFTNEEWDAAMDTDEFKAAKAKGLAAYQRATSKFRRKEQALRDRESKRVQMVQEREREKERQFREKIRQLEEEASRTGQRAESKVAFDTICKIVKKMREQQP